MSNISLSNKENQASSSNANLNKKRHTVHSTTSSSSGKKRASLIKKILGGRRRKSDDLTMVVGGGGSRKWGRHASSGEDDDLSSGLLSSFSRTSEAPMFGNFVKSNTVLQTFTNSETNEHLGFLKEVMPGKDGEHSPPRMTLHQHNVWEDGWLMEAHFTFKNYTEQQVTTALKFLHVHDNLDFLRFGHESVKVEAEKRYVFQVPALEGDAEQFVVRRKERLGNPRMLEISYRFGFKKNGRWHMTW